MRRIVGLLLCVLLLAGVSFAGGRKETKSQPTFVMVTKGVHPYYEPCFEGFRDAAKKYGVIAEKVDPPEVRTPFAGQGYRRFDCP